MKKRKNIGKHLRPSTSKVDTKKMLFVSSLIMGASMIGFSNLNVNADVNKVSNLNAEVEQMKYTKANGNKYLIGKINVLEWFNENGNNYAKVLEETPKMYLENIKSGERHNVYISHLENSYYYFDKNMEGLNESDYKFVVEQANKNNFKEGSIVTKNPYFANEVNKEQALDKSTINISGNILRLKKSSVNLNAVIDSFEYKLASNRKYFIGKVNVLDWVKENDKYIPYSLEETPNMYLENIDTGEKHNVYISHINSSFYYFDINAETLSKGHYQFVVEQKDKGKFSEEGSNFEKRPYFANEISTEQNIGENEINIDENKVTIGKKVTHLNAVVEQMDYRLASNSKYLIGKLNALEWFKQNGKDRAKVLNKVPKMYLENIKTGEKHNVYISYLSNSYYYFDINVNGLGDGEYRFLVEQADKNEFPEGSTVSKNPYFASEVKKSQNVEEKELSIDENIITIGKKVTHLNAVVEQMEYRLSGNRKYVIGKLNALEWFKKGDKDLAKSLSKTPNMYIENIKSGEKESVYISHIENSYYYFDKNLDGYKNGEYRFLVEQADKDEFPEGSIVSKNPYFATEVLKNQSINNFKLDINENIFTISDGKQEKIEEKKQEKPEDKKEVPEKKEELNKEEANSKVNEVINKLNERITENEIEELKKKYTEESINKYKEKVIEIKKLVDEIKEGINELPKEKNKENEDQLNYYENTLKELEEREKNLNRDNVLVEKKEELNKEEVNSKVEELNDKLNGRIAENEIEELKKKYTEESINKYKEKINEIKNLLEEEKEKIKAISKEKIKENEEKLKNSENTIKELLEREKNLNKEDILVTKEEDVIKKIELNNITDVKLFERADGNSFWVTVLDHKPTNLGDYYVKVTLNNKVLNLRVNNIELENGKYKITSDHGLSFVLGENTIQNKDIKTVKGYDENKKNIYSNIQKLLPYYNLETIVKEGNKLENTNILNSSKIVRAIPLNQKEVASSKNVKEGNANKVMVEFENNQINYYNLESLGNFESLKEYNIVFGENKKVLYTPEVGVNNDNINSIVNEVKEEYKRVSYLEDDKIFNSLKPNIRSLDKLTKKNEMKKTLGREVSDEEVLREVKKETMEKLSYKDFFKSIQDNIEEILNTIIANNENSFSENIDREGIKNKLLENKEKVLLGLTYIERLYNLKYDNINLGKLILYNPEFFSNKKVDMIDYLIKLGSLNYLEYKIDTANNNFKSKMSVLNANTLTEFLENTKNRLEPNISMNDWYKKASGAYFVERASKEKPNEEYLIYNKLKKYDQKYILPLLNVTKNKIYVITTVTTMNLGMIDTYVDQNLTGNEYDRMFKEFETKAKNAGDKQAGFLDFWFRVSDKTTHSNLISNRLVMDSLRLYNKDKYVNAKDTWSKELGESADKGVTELITPMGLYRPFFTADGQADGIGVNMFLAKALEDRGLTTYSHELTHLFDKTVVLNNNGRRDGVGVEFYARGMYETYEGIQEPILNLNLIFKDPEGGYRNKTPNRFKKEADLKTYMNGIFDVLYTLDYLEAENIVRKDVNTKKLYFNKIEEKADKRNADTGSHTIDSFRNITEEEASKLNNVNDLVDNDAVVSRYEYKGINRVGDARTNDYYTINMFSPIYAGIQNENGASGDVTMRRTFYELMAEFGYKGGAVPYISNQYKNEAKANGQKLSDTFILNKIFAGRYTNLKDFKKKMFERRINKLDQLKEIDITLDGRNIHVDSNTLKELMKEAVEKDIVRLKANQKPINVNNLKSEIYKKYLEITDEFNESIYK